MPLFDFKCGACGHADEEFFKMQSASTQECPKCGAAAYEKQVSVGRAKNAEFHKPVEMYSIGMEDIDEIREFKRAAPDVDCSDDPNHPMYGVPIARTRQAKLQALSAAGFEERK